MRMDGLESIQDKNKYKQMIIAEKFMQHQTKRTTVAARTLEHEKVMNFSFVFKGFVYECRRECFLWQQSDVTHTFRRGFGSELLFAARKKL